jgi:hypothetical protein
MGPIGILTVGILFFLVAYLGFAVSVPNITILAASFIVAGLAIGCIETCEHAAVATLAPPELRGSAFIYLALWSLIALLELLRLARSQTLPAKEA